MSDLMAFHATTAGGAGALALRTERGTNAPVHIELDRGIVAKIWTIQLEGNGIGYVTIQYSRDNGVTWYALKQISKPVATTPERILMRTRPIIVEAWNDVTLVRALEVVGGVAGLNLTVDIEFAELEKQ